MNEQKLLSTTDAQVWADQFVSTWEGKKVGEGRLDSATMIGWFANAMEVARSAEVEAREEAERERDEWREKLRKVAPGMFPAPTGCQCRSHFLWPVRLVRSAGGRMRFGRSAYRRSHEAVVALHAPDEVEGMSADCAYGGCEHSLDEECPVETMKVCRECFHLAYPEGTWDDLLAEEVMWPCTTFTTAVIGSPADQREGT